MASDFRSALAPWIGQTVVIDCISYYVVVGSLERVGDDYLYLSHADMHDLRDSETTRELYLVKTARLGVQSTRQQLVIRLDQVVGVSRLDDVVAG